MNIRILYEDRDVIVCEKPSGVPTQTKSITQKDMVTLLIKHRTELGEAPKIYVVHRLDQMTRGVMVFAKTEKAAAGLSKQLSEGFFDKKYYAKVEGTLLPEEGTLTDYLLHDKKNNISRIVSKDTPGAKKAVLSYKVVDRADEFCLLDIKLFTGRTHQIRCQMAGVNAPLCFDTKYGAKSSQGNFFLCAYHLSFIHPSSGEELSFEIKIDDRERLC